MNITYSTKYYNYTKYTFIKFYNIKKNLLANYILVK